MPQHLCSSGKLRHPAVTQHTRRRLSGAALALAGLGLLGLGGPAHAADFPSKPIRFVVPYAAGGTTAATLANRLGEIRNRYASQDDFLHDLDNSGLSEATLADARIDGARFTDAKLDSTIWTNRRRCPPGSVGECR